MALFPEDLGEERSKHMYWLHQSEIEPLTSVGKENEFGDVLMGFLPYLCIIKFLLLYFGILPIGSG